METSQCRTSHVNSFIHHLYTKDSNQKDRWASQLATQNKSTFRSKNSTHTDSISSTCWSFEDFTKHGQSSYSHFLPAPTLDSSPLCESSSNDDLSASWSSSDTSRSSLPSQDLEKQGHNGWLADFYSHSPSSPPMVSQQQISPAQIHSEQQTRTNGYTYYPRPNNVPAMSTPNAHTHLPETMVQDKMKNWEVAFDWYEYEKYSNDTTTTTETPINTTEIDSYSCSLETDTPMTMENETDDDALDASGHDSILEVAGRRNDTKLDKAGTTDMVAVDWNKLGMDLQDTEQDVAAIDAFRHAVDLDANTLDAWLNLAICYTNEHQRGNAYDCLEAWLQHNDKYQHIWKPDEVVVMMDRNTTLVDRYILAARCAPGDDLDLISTDAVTHVPATNEIDADVQVILGLLFYLADETQKSIDCFRTALACRPEDHRLWNQLGSVMLSQQPQQQDSHRILETSFHGAMDMYWSALYLNPEYTRARYNLAVAHMKLSQYDQAAHHLVTALTHQQQQQQRQQRQSSVRISNTFSPMWSSLRLVMYMMNQDHLANACNRYDITPFVSYLDKPCASTTADGVDV